MKPLVSILCITYNQEKYIKRTLESFLEQAVDFPIEIIIHDDASTDNTKKIIQEYARKYPKTLKALYEKDNQHSKGLYVVFLEKIYKMAQGKYLAWCEGDDYWTDPKKLQRQVDFLEKHPDYTICFHPVSVIFEKGGGKDHKYPIFDKGQKFELNELLKNNFIPTNSVMYRKQTYKKIPRGIMPVDWYMHLYHAQFGKIGFIEKNMATYHKHSGGIWWDFHHDKDKLWEKYGTAHLQFFVEVLKLCGNDPAKKMIIEESIARTIVHSIATEEKSENILLKKVIKEFPQFLKPLIIFERGQSDEYKKLAETRKSEIKQLTKKLEEKESAIKRRDDEIQRIKSIKVWRKAAKLLKKASKRQSS